MIRHNNYKPSWQGGKRYCFAPCGVCADCRRKYNYAWAWRLTSDFQYCVGKMGYQVGFVTLTYNPQSMPKFPETLSDGLSCPVAGEFCFSREHTLKLMDYVRKVSHKEKRLVGTRFLLSSEYGETTARPHYHLLIAWNPKLADAAYMHRLIARYWSEPLKDKWGNELRPALGFVTPKDLQGGESKRSGKKIMPFVVGSQTEVLKACFYASKYCAKSLAFIDVVNKIPKKYWRELKEYFPHHRQTKGLGSIGLESLSDSEKIDLLERGKVLLGDNRLFLPPLYIQNKFLFCNKYIFDDNGNRLCKRECTDFYKRNFDAIMKFKISYYDTLFSKMGTNEYWKNTGVNDAEVFRRVNFESVDVAAGVAQFFRDNDQVEKFGCKMSEAYIYYYGVPYSFCFVDKRLSFINRYRFPAYTYSSVPLISALHWNNIQKFFDYLMSFAKWQKVSTEDREPPKVREFWNEVVQS